MIFPEEEIKDMNYEFTDQQYVFRKIFANSPAMK